MSAMFGKNSALNPVNPNTLAGKITQKTSAVVDPAGALVRKKASRAAGDLLDEGTMLGQASPAIYSARKQGAI